MKSKNQVRIRYDRDALLATLQRVYPAESLESHEAALDAYERKRARGKDKPCQSLVYHGPGHQSSTYCQQRGRHSTHYADLPAGGYAEWTDDRPYADEVW